MMITIFATMQRFPNTNQYTHGNKMGNNENQDE